MQENTPATEADVRLISGSQRQGKSTLAVSFAARAYHAKMTGIISPQGELIKAVCINKEDKLILRKAGLSTSIVDYCRVFNDDETESKLIKIPKDYIVISPVHIFANFTIYGMKYVPTNLGMIIEYINTDLFDNAWILLDESVETDSRSSMEAIGKTGALFYATIGKRNAHFITMAQENGMVELRIRLFATTRILCSYDKDTRIITCDVTRKGQHFVFDLKASRYWRFFKSTEKVKVPQYKIDRARAKMQEDILA